MSLDQGSITPDINRRLNNKLMIKTHYRLPLLCGLLLCALLLSGCSQQFQRQTCVALSEALSYCLAPINEQVEQGAHSQTVQFSHDGQTHQLITELQIDKNTMTLVGLAPLGQPLFTIVYDGHRLISQQSNLLGKDFKAEYLMAILQLVYWPTDVINQHLSAGSWQQHPCQLALCRQLTADNNDVVLNAEYSQIEPWQAAIDIHIIQADVQIMIQALQ